MGGFSLRLLTTAGVVGVVVAVVGTAARPSAAGRHAGAGAVVVAGDDATDPIIGRQLFATSCATCHGSSGRGMPEQGVALTGSAFLAQTPDAALVAFLRTGRPSSDRMTLTGRSMPPRGGNPQLSDQDLADIVSYLRSFRALASLN